MDIAKQEDLIILTFDKDYGELIFKYKNNAPPAVIFFRYKGLDTSFAGETLLNLLSDNSMSVKDNFTVIEEYSVRQRKYKE